MKYKNPENYNLFFHYKFISDLSDKTQKELKTVRSEPFYFSPRPHVIKPYGSITFFLLPNDYTIYVKKDISDTENITKNDFRNIDGAVSLIINDSSRLIDFNGVSNFINFHYKKYSEKYGKEKRLFFIDYCLEKFNINKLSRNGKPVNNNGYYRNEALRVLHEIKKDIEKTSKIKKTVDISLTEMIPENDLKKILKELEEKEFIIKNSENKYIWKGSPLYSKKNKKSQLVALSLKLENKYNEVYTDTEIWKGFISFFNINISKTMFKTSEIDNVRHLKDLFYFI